MHASVMSPLSILAVYGDIIAETTLGRAAVAVGDKLRARGFEVVTARSAADGVSAILADPLIGCVMVDVDLDNSDGAEDVLRAFRARNNRAPAFLFGKRRHVSTVPLSTLKLANEFIWLTEDTPTLMAGRVAASIQRYRDNLLPPMFSAVLAQASVHEYAFGTPGHLGGMAFLKTYQWNVGLQSYHFHGELDAERHCPM
jgi:arginine decarboxylase